MNRIHEDNINTPEFFDAVWEKEWRTVRQRFDTGRMEAMIKRVKSKDKVIDLGAGCFGPAQFIAEVYNFDADLIALDFSSTARDRVLQHLAKTKYYNHFDYVVGDAAAVQFPDSWFDVVIAGELIEHQEDPCDLVAEMNRLCKPGGWLVISTVNPECEDALRHGEYPEHLWQFTPADLVNFFRPYGEAHYFEVGDYHLVECQKHV